MDAAEEEVNKILADIPKFRFTFPDMKNIKRLNAENSSNRKNVVQVNKAVDVFNAAEMEALEKLASINPDKFKEAYRRMEKIVEDLDENQ